MNSTLPLEEKIPIEEKILGKLINYRKNIIIIPILVIGIITLSLVGQIFGCWIITYGSTLIIEEDEVGFTWIMFIIIGFVCLGCCTFLMFVVVVALCDIFVKFLTKKYK